MPSRTAPILWAAEAEIDFLTGGMPAVFERSERQSVAVDESAEIGQSVGLRATVSIFGDG
mgnify:CR=1 FL=1